MFITVKMFRLFVLATISISFSSLVRAEFNWLRATCSERYAQATISSCCKHPLLMPPTVMKFCSAMKLPQVPKDRVAPIKSDCQAECALNRTKILVNKKISANRAKQVLTSRIPPNSDWSKLVGTAISKCNIFYENVYDYTRDIERNHISGDCLPTSALFLDCVLGFTFQDCPDASWIGGEKCSDLVRTIMDCPYIFSQSTVY